MNEPEHVVIDARTKPGEVALSSPTRAIQQAVDMIRIREEALPRPEGMSRPMYRRLYRYSCKRMGVESMRTNPTDKKEARRARKQALRSIFDKQPRSARKA